MNLRKRVIVLFGAALSFFFLMLNDPDALAPGVLDAWKWLLVFPAACALTMLATIKPRTCALLLMAGVLGGASVAALLHASNLWPIAGVYWTFVFALPLALGALVGALMQRLRATRG